MSVTIAGLLREIQAGNTELVRRNNELVQLFSNQEQKVRQLQVLILGDDLTPGSGAPGNSSDPTGPVLVDPAAPRTPRAPRAATSPEAQMPSAEDIRNLAAKYSVDIEGVMPKGKRPSNESKLAAMRLIAPVKRAMAAAAESAAASTPEPTPAPAPVSTLDDIQ